MCYLFYFVVVNRNSANILKPKSTKKMQKTNKQTKLNN